MKDRITKAIADYKQFTSRNKNCGSFYFYDIYLIQHRNLSEDCGRFYARSAIFDALEAGFMIGYRCAQRKARMKTTK